MVFFAPSKPEIKVPLYKWYSRRLKPKRKGTTTSVVLSGRSKPEIKVTLYQWYFWPFETAKKKYHLISGTFWSVQTENKSTTISVVLLTPWNRKEKVPLYQRYFLVRSHRKFAGPLAQSVSDNGPYVPSPHQPINSSIQPINPSTHRFNSSTHQL